MDPSLSSLRYIKVLQIMLGTKGENTLSSALRDCKAIIAGSSVLSAYCEVPFTFKDIDIYVSLHNAELFLNLIQGLIDGLNRVPPTLNCKTDFLSNYDPHYLEKHHIIAKISGKFKQSNISFDIMIVSDDYELEKLVQDFDLTCCEVRYDGTELIKSTVPPINKEGTWVLPMQSRIRSEYHRILTTTGNSFLLRRINKYVERGFEIVVGNTDNIDIELGRPVHREDENIYEREIIEQFIDYHRASKISSTSTASSVAAVLNKTSILQMLNNQYNFLHLEEIMHTPRFRQLIMKRYDLDSVPTYADLAVFMYPDDSSLMYPDENDMSKYNITLLTINSFNDIFKPDTERVKVMLRSYRFQRLEWLSEQCEPVFYTTRDVITEMERYHCKKPLFLQSLYEKSLVDAADTLASLNTVMKTSQWQEAVMECLELQNPPKFELLEVFVFPSRDYLSLDTWVRKAEIYTEFFNPNVIMLEEMHGFEMNKYEWLSQKCDPFDARCVIRYIMANLKNHDGFDADLYREKLSLMFDDDKSKNEEDRFSLKNVIVKMKTPEWQDIITHLYDLESLPTFETSELFIYPKLLHHKAQYLNTFNPDPDMLSDLSVYDRSGHFTRDEWLQDACRMKPLQRLSKHEYDKLWTVVDSHLYDMTDPSDPIVVTQADPEIEKIIISSDKCWKWERQVLQKQYLDQKDKWFYECTGKLFPTGDKGINVDKSQPHILFPYDADGLNVLVSVGELRGLVQSDQQMFILVPKMIRGQELAVSFSHTISFGAYTALKPGSYVSANHCQLGSNMLVYTLKAVLPYPIFYEECVADAASDPCARLCDELENSNTCEAICKTVKSEAGVSLRCSRRRAISRSSNFCNAHSDIRDNRWRNNKVFPSLNLQPQKRFGFEDSWGSEWQKSELQYSRFLFEDFTEIQAKLEPNDFNTRFIIGMNVYRDVYSINCFLATRVVSRNTNNVFVLMLVASPAALSINIKLVVSSPEEDAFLGSLVDASKDFIFRLTNPTVNFVPSNEDVCHLLCRLITPALLPMRDDSSDEWKILPGTAQTRTEDLQEEVNEVQKRAHSGKVYLNSMKSKLNKAHVKARLSSDALKSIDLKIKREDSDGEVSEQLQAERIQEFDKQQKDLFELESASKAVTELLEKQNAVEALLETKTSSLHELEKEKQSIFRFLRTGKNSDYAIYPTRVWE